MTVGSVQHGRQANQLRTQQAVSLPRGGNSVVRVRPAVPESCPVRKADITPDLVSELIAEQFPQWAGLPVRPVEADGVDNTTFRLGTEMSVRLPSSESYVEQVDKEQRWLPLLAPRLPLPIPVPLARGVPGCG